MNFDLYGFGPALAAGALMTVKLALTALCLGLVLGLAGALAKTSPYKPLQWLGGAYSTLVRGIPELLWVLLIYFGTVNLMRALGEFFGNPDLSLSAFAAGVIALGLCFLAPTPRKCSVARSSPFPRATVKPVWHWACRSFASSPA
jgi:polar amino acid transport system permease protein